MLALVLPVLHNREVDEAQTAVRRGHSLHVLVVLRLSSFGRAHLVHVVWRGHALGALGPTDVHPLAIGGEVIVSARRLLAVNDRIMHLVTVGIRADQVELDDLEVLIGEAADRHRVLGIPRLVGREDDRRGVHGLARLVGVARRPIVGNRFGLHVVQRHEAHCDGEAMLRVVAVVPVLDDADFGRLARTDPVVDPGGVGLGVIGAVGIPAVGRLCLQHEIAVTHAALVVLGQVLEVEMIGPRLLIRRPVKPLDRGGLGVRGAVQLKRADKTAVLEELHVRDARRVQIGMVLIGAVLRLDLRERTVRLLPVLVDVLLGHVLKGVRDGVRVRVERGSEGKLLVLALLVLEREGEGAAAVVVTLEVRLLVDERDARLDPAVLELVTVRVVLGEGIAERLGEDLGLPAINVDRLVGVLPRIVRALDAALRGELDHHVVKRVLERGDFPSLGGLDLHGAGQAVRNGPVVVDEAVGCAVGRVEPLRLAVLVRVVGIRVGDAAILAHGAVDGLVACRGRLLAQGVDIGVAIRVILGQVVENALSRFAILNSEERTEVDGALAILRNGDLHVANGAHRGPRLSLAGVSIADLVQLHLCGSRRTAARRVAPQGEGRTGTALLVVAVEPDLRGVVARGAHGTQRHGPAIIERVDRAAVARRSRVIVCRLEVVRARPGIRILEIGVVDDRGAILGVAGQLRGDGRRAVIVE
ncbi:unknown [Collinsella sp. CAG:398]|nr:unknown [Collinsella sp. CAG:398]